MGPTYEGRGRGEEGEGRIGKWEGMVKEAQGGRCPPPLNTLDPAVEEGREGRRASGEAWVGAFGHFFFHFKIVSKPVNSTCTFAVVITKKYFGND